MKELLDTIKSSEHCTDLQLIKQKHSSICLANAIYRLLCRDYVAFLEGSRSQEGQDLLSVHRENDLSFDKHVNTVLSNLEEKRAQIELDSKSLKSGSIRSSASSAAVKAIARAEAARVRKAYAEKEAELRKQEAALKEEEALSLARSERKRSNIQADIQVLQEHKLCAEAEAEAEIWEANSESSDRQSLNNPVVPKDVERSEDRTRKFVETHSRSDINDMYETNQNGVHKTEHDVKPKIVDTQRVIPEHYGNSVDSQLDPNVPNFTPLSVTFATEMSKFLVKKDLLFSRLTSFSDAPEEYVTWKTGFLQITKEMGVSNSEEIDLLVKWLGIDSRRHAISIKTSYVGNPSNPLVKIWERLDERYGSPEMIEAALKRKIMSFPKLSTQDQRKLYELSDLLSEVQATMNNPVYRNVLGYFDSSTGVNLIVQKLPYHLQNKWTQQAINYMRENEVTYPPFRSFCKFMHEMSSMLNNPNFMYEDKTPKNVRNNVEPFQSRNAKYSVNPVQKKDFAMGGAYRKVAVNKTGVSQPTEVPKKMCPLHGTSHSLNECRTFKAKQFDERKRLIREHGICFKCCESSDHKARDCKVSQNCLECNSERHPTALHIVQRGLDKVIPSSQAAPYHGG